MFVQAKAGTDGELELGCFIRLDWKPVESFVNARDLTDRHQLVVVVTVDFIQRNGKFENGKFEAQVQ